MAQAFEVNSAAPIRKERSPWELLSRFAPLIFLLLMMAVFATLSPDSWTPRTSSM